MRGYVSAYDARDRRAAWRFYIVPGDPSRSRRRGVRRSARRLASPTWAGRWYDYGGGGTVVGRHRLRRRARSGYVGTGNGTPWSRRQRSAGQGDNLFLSSVLALESGHRRVHLALPRVAGRVVGLHVGATDDAGRPHDRRRAAQNATARAEERLLLRARPPHGQSDLREQLRAGELGQRTSTWRQADRDHRERVLRGRAVRRHAEAAGAHNWSPWSFSPRTGLVYFQALRSITAL